MFTECGFAHTTCLSRRGSPGLALLCWYGGALVADREPAPMIDHSHRFIFVHIPKTAGNSVNRVFGVSWQNHKDLARYARECEAFETFFKFAIVRNPWDRLLSDYNYQKKKSRENKLHLLTPSGAVRSFKEWVSAVLADPFRYPA